MFICYSIYNEPIAVQNRHPIHLEAGFEKKFPTNEFLNG